MGTARGRRALVTGGAVRVGRAISLALAREGYDVVVHYHDSRDAAGDTVDRIRALGREGEALRADLTRIRQIPPLVAATLELLGGLDLLVNNAGIFPSAPPAEVTPEHWERAFALNARAPFFLIREAAPAMETGGCVVNVTDVAASGAWPGHAPYAASKAALESLTRSLARAFAPRIRVNAVAPGTVLLPEDATERDREAAAARSPLGGPGRPEDVGRAVLYLDGASYVTGETLRVDGGAALRADR